MKQTKAPLQELKQLIKESEEEREKFDEAILQELGNPHGGTE